MTMLSIISDFRTAEMPKDNSLTYSWDIIAYCRYLDMNPPKALEAFKKCFPSCAEIKIEPPVVLTSLDEYNPINDFAQAGVKLSGVLNHTTNNEGLLKCKFLITQAFLIYEISNFAFEIL